MSAELPDAPLTRRSLLQGAVGLVVSPDEVPYSLARTEKSSLAPFVDTVLPSKSNPDSQASIVLQATPLEQLINTVVDKVSEDPVPYVGERDFLGESSSATITHSLGKYSVELTHMYIFVDGQHPGDVALLNGSNIVLYNTNEASKNVSLAVRDFGQIVRKNNGYELSNKEFDLPERISPSNYEPKNLRRMHAYHFAVEAMGFRDVDLKMYTRLVQEVGNQESTFIEDELLPALRLSELEQFNTYWLSEFVDADFDMQLVRNNEGYIVEEAYSVIKDGQSFDLVERISEFGDLLKNGLALVEGLHIVGDTFPERLPKLDSEEFMNNFPEETDQESLDSEVDYDYLAPESGNQQNLPEDASGVQIFTEGV